MGLGVGDGSGSDSAAAPGLKEKAGNGIGLEGFLDSCRVAISSSIGCVGLDARSCSSVCSSSELTPGLKEKAGKGGSLELRDRFRL